jgi:predicted phosphodiesterase
MKRYLVIPDLHFPFHDKKYCKLILKILASEKFFGIIQLGDFMDCYRLSNFSKDPKRKLSAYKELMMYKSFLEKCLEHLPSNGEFHQLEGNHEQRFWTYANESAVKLIEFIRPIKDILFEGLPIKKKFWHPYDDVMSCVISKTQFHHGIYYNVTVAHKNLQEYCGKTGLNIVQGHTHRLQTSCNGYHFSVSLGCGVDIYKCNFQRKVPDVQHAYGVFIPEKSGDHFTPYMVRDGKSVLFGDFIR